MSSTAAKLSAWIDGLCLWRRDMKAKHCDECKHFNDEDVPGTKVCWKNHHPRWYVQKYILDTDWGYKKKCKDYEEKRNAGSNKRHDCGGSR